jgi:UDP-N-acetylmuramoyl-L-alanyl-D-glutamate--2,6-diaminopimelate ligase
VFNQLSRDIHMQSADKKLSEFISDIAVVQLFGPLDAPVSGITSDSRNVEPASIFVAIEGEHSDGHNFIHQAIEKGASVVVIQLKQYEEYLSSLLSPSYAQHNQVTVLVVQDTRIAVSLLAMALHDYPTKKLKMIGITGTNGKTTTSYLIKSVLEKAGEKVGLIGTIGSLIGDEPVPLSLTTPLAEDIQELLARMCNAGCTTCVMEVSSHALALHRVHGVMFDVTIYTNLSRDHMDFHGSFEEYARVKSMLFKSHSKGWKVLNSDDQYQIVMWDSEDEDTLTYGQHGTPAIEIEKVESKPEGTTVSLKYQNHSVSLFTNLAGAFNAGNVAASYGACKALGISDEHIASGLQDLKSVPGRFEIVSGPSRTIGLVDYSHTPDSLLKALVSASDFRADGNKLVVVFGCGGDRDRGKRPQMGQIASEHADLVIVTSDNPRTEEPREIIDEIVAGISDMNKIMIIEDRKAAIEKAVQQSTPGDVIVVAGKGHEKYQIIGTIKKQFDDVEVLRSAMNELMETNG